MISINKAMITICLGLIVVLQKEKRPSNFYGRAFVPEIGVEPIHSCERQILSLLRLPIPPPGQGIAKVGEIKI